MNCLGLVQKELGGNSGEEAKLPGTRDCLGAVGDIKLAVDT